MSVCVSVNARVCMCVHVRECVCWGSLTYPMYCSGWLWWITILHVGHVLFSSRYFTRQLLQTGDTQTHTYMVTTIYVYIKEVIRGGTERKVWPLWWRHDSWWIRWSSETVHTQDNWFLTGESLYTHNKTLICGGAAPSSGHARYYTVWVHVTIWPGVNWFDLRDLLIRLGNRQTTSQIYRRFRVSS